MKPAFTNPPARRAGLGAALRRRAEAAFTMVEIAIALGVVAFALVAIVGVLPTGLTVQKQNREETIINQDGNLWLEAIRGGAIGLDYLTNYVDYIMQTNLTLHLSEYYSYSPNPSLKPLQLFLSGRDIIGLLTLPRYTYVKGQPYYTNAVVAYVRAISGPASEKFPANDFAFQYRMTVELTPFTLANAYTAAFTNFNAGNLTVDQWQSRSNMFVRMQNLMNNLWDLRLTLEWPVYQVSTGPNRVDRRVGGNRKEFRTLASGMLLFTNVPYLKNLAQGPLPFLQPSQFLRMQ